jgi:pimeloyl-ACP methyl ester carboxylesterase
MAASVIFISACSSDDAAETPVDALVWRSCEARPNLECTTLKVPMDYTRDASEEITLGINRLPALEQPARGSILVNPGGPGGSGMALVEALSETDSIPSRIRNAFDIVGFDPRGIGRSTPVDCSEFASDGASIYLVDRAAIASYANEAIAVVQACADKYGSYLQQLGSRNVVRDMDEIRIALNEDTLNFIGYSYGSRLAGLYLQHYPETSGSLILDASMSPVSQVMTLTEQALPAMQKNLFAMLAQCDQFAEACNADDLHQQLIAKANSLRDAGNAEEADLLTEVVVLAIQSPELGDFLIGPLLTYLQTDDYSEIEVTLNLFGFDEEDLQGEDDETATLAVLCADDASRPTVDELEAALSRFNNVSDLLAESSVAQAASCVGWPQALEPLPEITTRNAPTSLVIAGASDANTPQRWSEEMASSIGGYLVVSEHRGHTGVFTEVSDCLDEIAEQFLLEQKLPDTDRCEANPE